MMVPALTSYWLTGPRRVDRTTERPPDGQPASTSPGAPAAGRPPRPGPPPEPRPARSRPGSASRSATRPWPLSTPRRGGGARLERHGGDRRPHGGAQRPLLALSLELGIAQRPGGRRRRRARGWSRRRGRAGGEGRRNARLPVRDLVEPLLAGAGRELRRPGWIDLAVESRTWARSATNPATAAMTRTPAATYRTRRLSRTTETRGGAR